MSDFAWFEQFNKTEDYQFFKNRPVAYFCAEFALSEKLPVYAGGLGVLAGDFVKEAADRDFPLVALGLYYREGYVCQALDEKGNIVETATPTKPQDAGLELVVDKNGQPLVVTLPIADRTITMQAWKWEKGNVMVYFLDTDMASNTPADRKITNRLYDIDKETRFKQEMVLGIGGVRLLEKLGIHPSVYHLNEGHSAMLVLDLIRHEMVERKIGFPQAKERVVGHIIFTNHTLVPAGDELFSNDLASALLSSYASEITVPIKDILELSLVQESSIFSMTMLSLRLAGKINAVSKLHQKKASDLWTDHPMIAITNGIHISTWDKVKTDAKLWENHQENKRKLLTEIKKHSDVNWNENELLIGWARRIVAYKRPLALFEDLERFHALAKNSKQPIRVVFAGQTPPGDTNGAELLGKLERIIKAELNDVSAFIVDYDLEVAKLLTCGCDIWLNTPVVGFEACGTSGMKAALNGALPVTTRDGWVDEVELFGVGWILSNDITNKHLLDVLEKEIVPMYYAVDGSGVSREWVKHMKNARELIQHEFSATKMLRKYIETMYLGALEGLGQG